MECGNGGMVERGQQFSFTLEPRETVGIFGKLLGKDFDGDLAPELGVTGPVNFSHSPRTDGGEDLVVPERLAGPERHGLFGP